MEAESTDPEALAIEYRWAADAVARRWAKSLPYPKDEDSLRQECWLALWVAAKKYQPSRGLSFRTFMYPALNWAASTFVKAERRGIGRLGFDNSAVGRVASPSPRDATVWSEQMWASVLASLTEEERRIVRLLSDGVEAKRVCELTKRSKWKVFYTFKDVTEHLRKTRPELVDELN